MKLSQREKILITILLIAVVSVVYLQFVFLPLRADTKALKESNLNLEIKYNNMLKELAKDTNLDKQLLNEKINANELSPLIISETISVITLTNMLTEDLFITTVGSTNTSLAYTMPTGESTISASFGGGKILSPNYSVPSQPGSTNATTNYRLYYYPFNLSFVANKNGTDGLSDIYSILNKLNDEYTFIHVTSLTISNPTMSNVDSRESRFSAKFTFDVYLAYGNFDNYLLGKCPECDAYNEYTATKCVNCGITIDDCPNPNCHTILHSNASDCHECHSALENCPNCRELTLTTSNVCSKCGKSKQS